MPPFSRRSSTEKTPGYRPRLEVLEDRSLMSAGALDTTFNPTGSPPGTVTTSLGALDNALAIQPDGKIVAEGGIGSGFGVARYNANGSLDTGFNGTGSVTTRIGSIDLPNDVAIQSDGKIVVSGGSRLTANPLNPSILDQFALVRYTTTGTLDQSFGQHGIATSISYSFGGLAKAMTIQPDGKIVLAGYGKNSQNAYGIGLVRFNSNGSLDNSFGKGGWVFTPDTVLPGSERFYTKDVAIDSAGRLVVVGAEGSGGTSPFVARYSSAGSLDTSLGGTGVIRFTQFATDRNITHVALQTDGKILLGLGGNTRTFIRLNANGSLDTTSFGPLNPDGTHAGYVVTPVNGDLSTDIQLESDGKIVWGGYMYTDKGNGFGAVRLLSDGRLDPSFGSGGISQLENSVYGKALAIQPVDGNIVVAGQGVISQSTSGFGVARFVGDTPTPAGASTLGVAYFSSAITAGFTGTFTVWADNAVVALATAYTGTVHFTSSDPLAVLPADYTFTAADHGAHTFSATFGTPSTQSLFVTDTATSSLAAGQTGILVRGTYPSHFSLSAPASVTSGVAFSLILTALDGYGHVVAYGYGGTVHFTSSDPSATLPPDYTFVAADKGVHTFTGLVLSTKGVQTFTITDVLYGTIFGSLIVDVL